MKNFLCNKQINFINFLTLQPQEPKNEKARKSSIRD